MTFKFKTPSKRRPSFNVDRLQRAPASDSLTGWVHGKEASDLEEYLSNALKLAGYKYSFRISVPVPGGYVSSDKEVDFLVDLGLQQPIEVDGYIGHHTAAQKGADILRENLLNAEFARIGWRPIKRVRQDQVSSQERANFWVRSELLWQS